VKAADNKPQTSDIKHRRVRGLSNFSFIFSLLGTPSRKIAKALSHRKKFRLILPLDAEVFEEANH
jgi:hypothetical protein